MLQENNLLIHIYNYRKTSKCFLKEYAHFLKGKIIARIITAIQIQSLDFVQKWPQVLVFVGHHMIGMLSKQHFVLL